MERLTTWNDKTEGAELISWNEEEWKDFMGSLDVPICTELSLAVDKLAEYEDAEELGLLLRLPVPEGTDVYELIKIVDYGEVGDKGKFKYYHRKTKFCRNMIEEFGETVFLTEGQAAQKIHDIEEKQTLEKMETNNNE